jgi:hypothetical protein
MLNSDYRDMLSILKEEGVDFVVVGAYALAAHGFPRATGDLDVLVAPTAENSRRVLAGLKRFGSPTAGLAEDTFAQPGTIFQVGVAPRRIDIITEIDAVPFGAAAADATVVDMEGLRVPFLSRANLIKNKKATGREKDRLDAETLMGGEAESSG